MNRFHAICGAALCSVACLGACATTSAEGPKTKLTVNEGKTIKLDNVRLLVTRFDEVFRFWRDTMGFEVTFGKEGQTYAHFVAPGGGHIAIFSRAKMAEAVGTEQLPSTVKAQDTVCLVFEVPDVDQSYAALVKKGVKFVMAPADKKGWGIRVAHLRDPDGNLIEIMTSLPREER